MARACFAHKKAYEHSEAPAARSFLVFYFFTKKYKKATRQPRRGMYHLALNVSDEDHSDAAAKLSKSTRTPSM
jgi:hypothetical protein